MEPKAANPAAPLSVRYVHTIHFRGRGWNKKNKRKKKKVREHAEQSEKTVSYSTKY
jgi:hypothetical protein